MSDLHLLTQEKIEQIKNDAWLGIYVNEKTLYNPLENIPSYFVNDPQIYFSYLMSRPEYFQFICKEILNMEIFPFQSVILQEMWNHKFPMLVASRGASKCVTYETKIITKDGIKSIGEVIGDSSVGERVYFDNLEVYSETGWQKVEYGWNNGEKETVIIELENGMTIEATLNHPLRIATEEGRDWRDAGKITEEDELVLEAPETWFDSKTYSEDYVNTMSSLDCIKTSLPESIFCMSKEDILKYINNTVQENGKYTTLYRQKARDIQVLFFYATGFNSILTKTKQGYSVRFTKNKINKCKVKSITRTKNITYDIHLYKDHSFLSNGMVSHNSFTLALYALLRAILLPGRKVIIVGSVFRQSKVIFNYLTKMYNNAPLLMDANNHKSPKMYPDRCELEIGESLITALPVGCLSKDTLITTENGIYEIGDFSKENPPLKIWGVNKYKDIGYYFDNGVHKVKKITTKQGYEYIGTYNHKMKVVRDNKIIWCRTDEMVVGDNILIDRSERWYDPTFNSTDDEGYALGCMIGDGSYVNDYRLQFTTTDYEFIDHLKVIGDFKKKKDEDKFFIFNKELINNWLSYWNMDKAYAKDKKLPSNLLKSKKSVVANCIAGLIDTDGHIYSSNFKGGLSLTINYTTISSKLAKQLQYILLHFGIQSSLRFRDRNVTIRGKKANTQRCYELMISGEDVLKFYKNIPLRLTRKKNKLEEVINKKTKFNSLIKNSIPISSDLLVDISEKYNLGHRLHVKDIKRKKTITRDYLSKFLNKCFELQIQHDNIEILKQFNNPNICYDTIKTIEEIDELHTVDVNVPEDNTYCANGFVSHNSGQSIRGYRSNDTIADEFSCVRGDTLVNSELGFLRIEDFAKFGWPRIVNMNGEYETPSRFIVTPPDDVYKIITDYGYELYCSPRHKYLLESKEWKLGKDLEKGDRVILDSYRKFTEKYVEKDNWRLDDNIGWLLGILISEGTLTNRNHISIKNTDKELINKIKEKFSNWDWRESYKEPYKDKRGWNCKESWELRYYDTGFRKFLEFCGVGYNTALEKEIPYAILRSPKSVLVNFLSGLYEGDGSAFHNNTGKENRTDFRVVYYSSSLKLIKTLHKILLSLGIYGNINTRKPKNGSSENYILVTRNSQAKKLFEMLNVVKWKNISPGNIPIKRTGCILEKKGKFYCSTSIDNKNKHIGTFSSREDAEKAFENFINSRPETLKVVSVEKLAEKEVLYDFEMPETHSFIGNGFVNHNSQSQEVFETVIAGFGNVSQSPIANAKEKACLQFLRAINQPTDESIRDDFNKDNQIILTGSAYYYFNHFAQYWERWRSIIYSQGIEDKLYEIFKGEIPPGFNWQDYSILRLPIELLPPGFMDEGQIARSKATMTNSIFMMEMNAVFSKDSDGFFKASSIEDATANYDNNIIFPSSKEPVIFDPRIKGDPQKQYVMGVDPASEVDNFSVVILELQPNHNRVVYCWTTNSRKFQKKKQRGLIDNKDYYGFCARKIRDLMKDFNIVHIALDAQGGGKAVYEAFQDDKNMKEGELPLLEIIESDKKKDSDGMPGLHIVELVQFSNYEYLSSANHNLKKDIEDKVLLFPRYSVASLAIQSLDSNEEDLEETSIYDTLEDCIIELQELKFELAQIVVTVTPNGRERWDTPEVKVSGTKKGRARKDRYSSLLISNAASRKISRGDIETTVTHKIEESQQNIGFIGPIWATKALEDLYS